MATVRMSMGLTANIMSNIQSVFGRKAVYPELRKDFVKDCMDLYALTPRAQTIKKVCDLLADDPNRHLFVVEAASSILNVDGVFNSTISWPMWAERSGFDRSYPRIDLNSSTVPKEHHDTLDRLVAEVKQFRADVAAVEDSLRADVQAARRLVNSYNTLNQMLREQPHLSVYVPGYALDKIAQKVSRTKRQKLVVSDTEQQALDKLVADAAVKTMTDDT